MEFQEKIVRGLLAATIVEAQPAQGQCVLMKYGWALLCLLADTDEVVIAMRAATRGANNACATAMQGAIASRDAAWMHVVVSKDTAVVRSWRSMTCTENDMRV